MEFTEKVRWRQIVSREWHIEPNSFYFWPTFERIPCSLNGRSLRRALKFVIHLNERVGRFLETLIGSYVCLTVN